MEEILHHLRSTKVAVLGVQSIFGGARVPSCKVGRESQVVTTYHLIFSHSYTVIRLNVTGAFRDLFTFRPIGNPTGSKCLIASCSNPARLTVHICIQSNHIMRGLLRAWGEWCVSISNGDDMLYMKVLSPKP